MMGRTLVKAGGDQWVPRWAVSMFWGLDSWLLGVRWERHPREWTLEFHLGPIMFTLEHVE